MRVLKVIAFGANAMLLQFAGWMFLKFGTPADDVEALLLLLMVLAPVATIGYFVADSRNARHGLTNDPGLISLEVEVRKARLQNELKSLRDEGSK